MFHVSPGMIEQQLALVLDTFKTVSVDIKIRKACHSNTLHLCENLTTRNSLKI